MAWWFGHRERAAGAAERNRHWLFGARTVTGDGAARWRSPALIGAICALVVVGGWLGFRALWRYMVDLQEFRVYPGTIELGRTVEWLDSQAFRQDLLRRDVAGVLVRDGQLRGYSILAPDLSRVVARAYEQSPWVRRTLSVRRCFPNRLQVQLDLRRPYTWVEYRGHSYLVDREGVWLDSRIYRVPAGGLRCAPIRITQVEHQPVLGKVWDDPGVQLGLDMARYIEANEALFQRFGLRGVEIRQEGSLTGGNRNCAVLMTGVGTEIRWGSSPYQSPARAGSEVSPSTKVRALRAILQEHGAELGEFEYIDVRWDRPALKPRSASRRPFPQV